MLNPESRILNPIGLLGGSFDPIHVGHLQLARAARDRLGLVEVRLIPAAQPWQKGSITDAAQRARMVALAIAGEPGLVLDMHEIERGGPSYTIDTLRALRATLGPAQPLVLLLGADQMARLDTWREWRSLLDYAHIAVARRNGEPTFNDTLRNFYRAHRSGAEALRAAAAGAIVDLPMDPVDASASEIRALLAAPPTPARQARLAALVPSAVLLYIRRQGLYAPPTRLATREKATTSTMNLHKLQRLVVDALEDVKAQDIRVFNTVGLSDMFDRVVLASGSSNRQTRALASNVVEKVKEAGAQVVSVEGTDPGEWVLVDLGDVIVHIMQPAIRQYYALEEVWGARPVRVRLGADGHAQRRARTPAETVDVAAVAPARETGRAGRKSPLARAPKSPQPPTKSTARPGAKSRTKPAKKAAARSTAKPARKSPAKSAAKSARRSAAKPPKPIARKTARKSVSGASRSAPAAKAKRTGAARGTGARAAPARPAARARKTARGRASRA